MMARKDVLRVAVAVGFCEGYRWEQREFESTKTPQELGDNSVLVVEATEQLGDLEGQVAFITLIHYEKLQKRLVVFAPCGKKISDVPLSDDLHEEDAAYGLTDYCIDQLKNGELADQVADSILHNLLVKVRNNEPAECMGFKGQLIQCSH
jgi:hypothetical protein